MGERQGSDLKQRIRSNKWLLAGLVAGAVVVGLVLACVVGWGIYGAVGSSGADAALRGSRYLEAPPSEPVVVEEKMVEMPAMEPASSADLAYQGISQAYAAERLIIRTGNISMVVEDTRAAQGAVEEMVARMASEGAFVVSSDEYGGTEPAANHHEHPRPSGAL